METGLLHNYFGKYPIWSEKYYFCMEGSMWGEIETNHGNRGVGWGSWGQVGVEEVVRGWGDLEWSQGQFGASWGVKTRLEGSRGVRARLVGFGRLQPTGEGCLGDSWGKFRGSEGSSGQDGDLRGGGSWSQVRGFRGGVKSWQWVTEVEFFAHWFLYNLESIVYSNFTPFNWTNSGRFGGGGVHPARAPYGPKFL